MSLAPTVVGPVVGPSLRLVVEGLVAGLCTIETSVDPGFATGVSSLVVVSDGSVRQAFPLPPLFLKGFVRVWPAWGSPSPPEAVHPVAYAPAGTGMAVPRLPGSVLTSDSHVLVIGAVPGGEVRLQQLNVPVGSALAEPDGTACVPLTTPLVPSTSLADRLLAYVVLDTPVGPLPGPLTPLGTVVEPGAAAPSSPRLGALHVGQEGVRVRDLEPHGTVDIVVVGGTLSGVTLGSAPVCQREVDVLLSAPLMADQVVAARQGSHQGPAITVIEGAPAPRIAGPVTAGDTSVWVDGLVPGAEVTVVVRPDPQGAPWLEVRHGPRKAGFHGRLPLTAAVPSGEVTVEQTLASQTASYTAASEAVAVEAPPAPLEAPTLIPQLGNCGGAILVVDVHHGAVVRAFQDDRFIGEARTGRHGHVHLPVTTLHATLPVQVEQGVAGLVSTRSPAVAVAPTLADGYRNPRLVPPLLAGEDQVLVSGVNPGSLVRVRKVGGEVIGWAVPAEPLVRVQVPPLAAADVLVAEAVICEFEVEGEPRIALKEPGAGGPHSVHEAELTVDGTLGQLYWPTAADGTYLYGANTTPPLVLIFHGAPPHQNDFDGVSHLGYGYLAEVLASHGMVVFSPETPGDPTGEFALATIDALRSPALLAAEIGRIGPFAGSPVALIGHSRGAQEAIEAERLDAVDGTSARDIRALVSFPVGDGEVPGPLQAPLLAISGSMDYSGLRTIDMFDAAARPKTLVWVHRAHHHGYNTEWQRWVDDHPEGHDGDFDPILATVNQTISLPGEAHQRLAKALVTPFLLEHLGGLDLGSSAIARNWRPPPSARDIPAAIQHLSLSGPEVRMERLPGGPAVIENFGDEDELLGIEADDSDLNTIGGTTTVLEGADRDYQAFAMHAGRATIMTWDNYSIVLSTSLPEPAAVPPPLGLPTRRRLFPRRIRLAEHVLAMRAIQLVEAGAPLDAVREPLDLVVRLTDRRGRIAVATSRTFGGLRAPDLLSESIPLPPGFRNAYTYASLRVPLDAFAAGNNGVDLKELGVIELQHPSSRQGLVRLDDIEVSD